jgi:hypothetical protein
VFLFARKTINNCLLVLNKRTKMKDFSQVFHMPEVVTSSSLEELMHLCGSNDVTLYWLLGSSVQKQAHQDGKRNPFPACKHRRVCVESDVVTSILMFGQRYSQGREKLLVWLAL